MGKSTTIRQSKILVREPANKIKSRLCPSQSHSFLKVGRQNEDIWFEIGNVNPISLFENEKLTSHQCFWETFSNVNRRLVRIKQLPRYLAIQRSALAKCGEFIAGPPGVDDKIKTKCWNYRISLIANSPAPNQSCNIADVEVPMSSPVFCQCIVVRRLYP